MEAKLTTDGGPTFVAQGLERIPETASQQPSFDRAEAFEGPTMDVTDVEGPCAFARFCDPEGRVWNLIGQTDHPEAGRLVGRGSPCSGATA